MYISTCIQCYDDKHGRIVKVNCVDEDDSLCGVCGEERFFVYTSHQLGVSDGDYSHTSSSLAINPCQARAHRKLFPGIGVLPDGQIHFDSVKKQSDYLKKTGFNKRAQRIKKKGVKIA